MFVRGLFVLLSVGAALADPPLSWHVETPGLDYTPDSTATFTQAIPENFNPNIVVGGGLTWGRENVNATGNYTFTICGTTTIFPTATTQLWSAAYCTIWVNLVCTVKKAHGFTFLNADPDCTVTLTTPVSAGTYNFRVWYRDTDIKGAVLANFHLMGNYCPNYGYEVNGDCVAPAQFTKNQPIPANQDKQFFLYNAAAPVDRNFAEITFAAFPNPTEKRKRSLFPAFELASSPESGEHQVKYATDVQVYIQKNGLPDDKDMERGSVGMFGFNKSETAMVSIGAPGSGAFLVEVSPTAFSFSMNVSEVTCEGANTHWAGNGAPCAEVAPLNFTANTAYIKTGPSFYYFDVNTTMTQFMVGARLDQEPATADGPMVFLRKGDVPSTTVYDVAASGSTDNFISVDSFGSTGRFYVSIFPLDNNVSYVFWVNSICPGNCSAQGSCNSTNPAAPQCVCDEDWKGVFCQEEDNGGFKTEYIVLIVIGTIIVCASIIGLFVFFYNKNREGYENIS